MWMMLGLGSAFCLGLYDICKKISVRANNVLVVLMLNTLFGALLMSPVIILGICHGDAPLGGGGLVAHGRILLKSAIVLGSWILGYYAIKHLPLTIQAPINASRPVLVLVGALCIFGERLTLLQWIGIMLGFLSLFFISRLGSKEGYSPRASAWVWLSIGATALGAISALYDKYLLGMYEPLQVQAWYSLYQCIAMCIVVSILLVHGTHTKFEWRWSILGISIFLTIADIAYFYSLSMPGSMVAVVSMLRRGSVVISFLYGVIWLKEKNIKAKLLDLLLLILSLTLLVLGNDR